MSHTYCVPAFDQNEAREIAYAVDAGRIGHIEHYIDEAAAHRVCGHLNPNCVKPRRVFAILLEQRATDDGRIPIAWPVDRIGDAAAALLLFAGAPMLATACWGLRDL